MKRSKFLRLAAGLGSVMGIPLFAKPESGDPRIEKGFKVDAGKDRFNKSISLLQGDTFYTKVSTKDTAGDLYIYESTRIKEGGPTLHYHTEVDEWWYILKGEFIIKVGEETYKVKAGDSVFGPRKVPHAFAKVGEGEGKLLMLFQPAGKMEEFFKALSEGWPSKLSPDEQDAFRKEHGIIRVGPPLTKPKAW